MTTAEPTRANIDHSRGPMLLEFGATWCGYCRQARPRVDAALREHPDVRHVWVEDGPGRPLGRSFRVKLWPTLVFLRDGQIVSQVSRPSADEIDEGFARLRRAATQATAAS